jgi:hypothetical protein
LKGVTTVTKKILVTLVSILFLQAILPADLNSQTTLYRPTGQEAGLVGTIIFDGNAPPSRRIDMSADPVCKLANPNGRTEDFVTTGNKLQNVFVYLRSGDPLTRHTFEQTDTPAVLEHKNCFFRPRVLGIRVNQPLRIENNDPTQHNTHPVPKLNPEWNQSQAEGGPPLLKSFEHPEIIPVRDNQHPWEKAFVGVFSHPFFAVSDVYGRYEIRGVPPGTYKIVAWHEKLGEQEFEITLAPGEARNLDLVFGRESR